MKQTEEWGEMIPITESVYGYNESMANDYFPLNKEQAIAKGWKWHERIDEHSTKGIVGSSLPDKIGEIPPNILDQTFAVLLAANRMLAHQRMFLSTPRPLFPVPPLRAVQSLVCR